MSCPYLYREIQASKSAFCAMKPLPEMSDNMITYFSCIVTVLLIIELILKNLKIKSLKHELIKTENELNMAIGNLKSNELLIKRIYQQADTDNLKKIVHLIESSDE